MSVIAQSRNLLIDNLEFNFDRSYKFVALECFLNIQQGIKIEKENEICRPNSTLDMFSLGLAN